MPPSARALQRNPFEIGLLAEGDHFADREAEVARMARAFREPGTKLIVYGDRRLGKSSAMRRAAAEVRNSGIPVVTASLAVATDGADAARRVLAAVQAEVGRGWRDLVQDAVGSLGGTIEIKPSPDPALPPSFAVGFGARERRAGDPQLLPDALDAVNAQLERRGLELGLGLDEFQQVHSWGGEAAEWALKDAFERHRRIGYVLTGSRRHQIEAMISGKGRALWKQMDPLPFGPIDAETLASWVVDHAGRSGVRIPLAEADQIVRIAGPRTRDIVQLARAVWDGAAVAGRAADGAADQAMARLVTEQAAHHEATWRSRPASQQRVLRALAAEPGVQITSADAARTHRLPPKSTVASALDALVDDELLAHVGGGGYTFDDPFFNRWIRDHVLPDSA